MFFILTSRWLLGLFYHHQNLALAFDLYFSFANNLPIFYDDQNNMFKISTIRNLTSRFVGSTICL